MAGWLAPSNPRAPTERNATPVRRIRSCALPPQATIARSWSNSACGDPDRRFPDRRRHGDTTGERLGRPNPLLHLPSKRALHRLRRRHGIRSAKVFGSAVRTDFRPDSDVDLAIELDRKPTLSVMIAIEQGFEELFGRDVDVILTANARPRVQSAIQTEGVEILR